MCTLPTKSLVTASVRKNCSNLHLNNCVRSKCKHVESCIIQQSAVSSNKNGIPKAEEPQIKQTSVKPDVPSLVMLFQAVGFQLREFEKSELSKAENSLPNESIKVTIQCGSSQMKAVLEMDGIDCQCPSSKDVKEGSLWSICGTGHTNNDSISSSKYEDSGSNLLPSIPKGVNNVVRDVVYRLFKIMSAPSPLATANSCNDLNLSALGNVEITESPLRRSESKDGIHRSHTQPNIKSARVVSPRNKLLTSKNLFPTTFNENNDNNSKDTNEPKVPGKPLQRQQTWHMDLDIDSGTHSPNRFQSPTPVDEMCDSLGHISIESEDEKLGIGDFVLKAYHSLDRAIRIMTRKTPMTSSTLSLNNEFFDNPPPLSVSTTATASPSHKPTSRPGSACSVSTRASQKTLPPKAPPTRRSVPASMPRKTTERPPTGPGSELSYPLRRKTINTVTVPLKAIPPKPPAPKIRSSISVNSTTLGDKVALSAKRGISNSVTNSPLLSKRNTFGPNTSLRGPTHSSTSKPILQTSTGTPGSTKFGFSRK
ncbi:uncharacterized protein LOC117182011 isoform X2 [Belonocnema kinseyi]|uniref:uncharacterized protein LOC117182011 isoform X2 n=1 Tax=Belonocnema kinseyi TaxID=2817044 RepID=UPI00143D3AEC|nr:uncharacterized protein LOC117182011 isoform X2 [Belonocnema kinseyi]